MFSWDPQVAPEGLRAADRWLWAALLAGRPIKAQLSSVLPNASSRARGEVMVTNPRSRHRIGPSIVGTNAVLNGFTLTNGHTRIDADYYGERSGGGALCEPSAVISNCSLIADSAGHGGGGSGGTLNNCTMTGNSGNSANGSGCGASSSTLNNCTLSPMGASLTMAYGYHGEQCGVEWSSGVYPQA